MLRLPFLRRPWPGRSAWLLWLALLLPLAQLAMVSHALLHQQEAAQSAEAGKQAPAASHCELCLLAAVIGTGGAASSPPELAFALAPPAVPAQAPGDPALADPACPYHSRAPPSCLA